jgi:SAM-dependent methyltransferase
VTAAQAFHWFEPQRARAECLRILRPGGLAAIIWNDRVADDPLNRALDQVFDAWGGSQRQAQQAVGTTARAWRCSSAERRRRTSNWNTRTSSTWRDSGVSCTPAPTCRGRTARPGPRSMRELAAIFGDHATHGEVECVTGRSPGSRPSTGADRTCD